MTTLKLMNMVYIANGWMLGLHDKPLISEDVEAWKFGPVIPELYRDLRENGCDRIEEILNASKVNLSDDQDSIVKQTYNIYSPFKAAQLVELNHREGTPWHKVKSARGVGAGIVIPREVISQYYKCLFNHSSTAPEFKNKS